MAQAGNCGDTRRRKLLTKTRRTPNGGGKPDQHMEAWVAGKSSNSKKENQQYVAYFILGFSGLVLTALGPAAVAANPRDAINIFNVIPPVVASWVGTVLAYYFGKANFDAANEQVRETGPASHPPSN